MWKSHPCLSRPMANTLRRILSFQFPAFTAPLALLAVCLVSYSLLISHLGFYWDDWPINWIAQRLGSDGLTRYFSTNRPIWGMLYKLTTPLLGPEPWHWHIFAVFWRWLSAVALWWLLRVVWPRHQDPALWAGLLLAVYPGSVEQFIALVYSHFFIVLAAFFTSLACSIHSIRTPRFFWPLTIAGLLLSLLNLATMEYFFLLELLRPALIWVTLRDPESRLRNRLKRTILHWLPYLLIFLAVGIWRTFFFSFQKTNYRPTYLENLGTQPVQSLLALLGTALNDIWVTTFVAWGQVFILPNPDELGRITTLIYAVVVLSTATALIIYLLRLKDTDQKDKKRTHTWAFSVMTIGVLGLLLGGIPFWMIELPVNLGFPSSRLTIAFMPGVSLFLAGFLGIIPVPRWTKLVILGLSVSLAAGFQFQTANTFRRDNDIQNALFWQMTWRIPQLEPGTALLINYLPVHFSTDNSLTGALNWIYTPENTSVMMPYYMYYPSMRLGTSLPYLEGEQTIKHDYLAATFIGSTAQVLAVYFEPPACFRVLDPYLDPVNIMLPEDMRYAAKHSTRASILSGDGFEPVTLQTDIFGPEVPHGWCYYFEKGDLARQQGDWEQVASIGDEAFALNDYPNDPSERIPFIEGYALVGRWGRAIELSREAYLTEVMQPVLCRLWERIDENTEPSADKDSALRTIRVELECEDDA